jgi:hypothetical protein
MEIKQYDEQTCLRMSAAGSLHIGLALMSFALFDLLSDGFNVGAAIFAFVFMSLLLRGLYFSVSVAMFGPKPSSKGYWSSLFQDEYLNYLNMKGYKWAFMTISGLLFILYFGGEKLSSGLLQEISIKNLAMFQIGVVWIAYSTPILFELRKEE